MSSSYWKSQLDYLYSSRPASSSSYYNQSFVDKINEAQRNIDGLVSEKDKSWSETNQAQDTYNAFQGSMKSYDDVYKSNENEFGVQEAKETYEKSKEALAMAETTLEALPSSINSASNRVLTQSQREARYNTLSNIWSNTQSIQEKNLSTYEEAWKNARSAQAEKTQAEISQQWSQLSDYGNAWTTAMNKYNDMVANVASAKEEKSQWESQYRTWQNQQWQNAYTIWSNQLDSALSRYKEALSSEQSLRNYNRTMEQYNKVYGSSFDFGNGYTIQSSNGYAKYFKNGQSISAGQFLEGSGANGANWNAWNSVWNSGVRTTGVGSDTVEAFNRKSSVGNYSYLF